MTDNIKLKDPNDDSIDYAFDFAPLTNEVPGAESDWLSSGETIVSYELTVDDGITLIKASITNSSTRVTLWVSGGTAGDSYNIACKITTNTSPQRIIERTMTIQCLDL